MLDIQTWLEGLKEEPALERLAHIEAKLDLILNHLNIVYLDPGNPDFLSEEVMAMADQKRKIDAVKLHREQTGATLREAKKAIERYMQRC